MFIFLSQSQLIQWFRFSFNKSITLHNKPYFLFPNILKRWSFQQNRTGIWSFLYYQERWYFFFSKIWSYSLDTKGKMIFLKKMSGKIIFSSNVMKGWSFQEIRAWTWSFCNIWKDGISFFQKLWYFFFRRKMKEDDLYQKTRGNMIFSLYLRRR